MSKNLDVEVSSDFSPESKALIVWKLHEKKAELKERINYSGTTSSSLPPTCINSKLSGASNETISSIATSSCAEI